LDLLEKDNFIEEKLDIRRIETEEETEIEVEFPFPLSHAMVLYNSHLLPCYNFGQYV